MIYRDLGNTGINVPVFGLGGLRLDHINEEKALAILDESIKNGVNWVETSSSYGTSENIIGKFGVGFYSVFMVADEVVITSRSFQKDAAPVEWRSNGVTNYEIKELDEKKMDKNVCKTQHIQIENELQKGDKKFEKLIVKHDKATDEMNEINKNLSLLNQKLEILSPFIDKAASLVIKG